MGLLLQPGNKTLPVADTARLDTLEVHMRSGAEQTVLEVLAETVVDGQRNNERSHARSHADDRNNGNYADYGLAAFGPKVTRGNKKFEPQMECHSLSRVLLKRSLTRVRDFGRRLSPSLRSG